MQVNVRAPTLLIERFARAQDGSADALVANLLDAKLAAPNPDFLSYTLSKQALAGLTELAARALAPRGVRVNGIAPALMLRSTGQSEENFEAMDQLRTYLEVTQQMNPIPELHLQPDATARYEVVDEGLAITKRAHVQKMGFVGNEYYQNIF